MMPRADCNAFLIQRFSHFFWRNIIEDEREYAGFLFCCPNQAQAGDGQQTSSSVLQKLVLVVSDVLHANFFKVVESGTQTYRVSNVSRPCFESRWGSLINGLLKRDIDDHVAAALPWRCVVENVGFTENHTNPSRRKN